MTTLAARPDLLRVRVLAIALALAGFSPFQVEERNVREGNERVAAGDPARALPHYEAAEKAIGPRPEIDYDRGVALHRGGRSAEARDSFRRALERGAGPLSSRASQNLGNALAALGDREGAKQAFVEALRQDPRNDDARFNLEVLLRKEQEERRRDQDPSQPRERDPQDPRHEQSQNQEQREPQQQPKQDEAQEENRQRHQEQRPAQTDGAAQERRAAEERDRTGQAGRAMSRDEAERILDAFRSRERPMPLAKKRRSLWGGHGDRDW